MNKVSDNFYAEMLVKHLGAVVRGVGTTTSGCIVVRRELAERGVPLAGVRIADGSGLSSYDRTTANAVGQLLLSAWRDPALRDPFFASLAVAGVDGTLEDRMRDRARARPRAGEDGHAEHGLGPVRLRGDALRLRRPPERLPDLLDARPPLAGPLRPGARAHPDDAPRR